MRTAIVGTSHVIMLKDAIEKEGAPNFGQQPFWFSLPAPTLSKQNNAGWPGLPGTMSCNISEARHHLIRTLKNADLYFDPAQYDVVILVDFFFGYDYCWHIRDRDRDRLAVKGTPVSGPMYRRILEAKLGCSVYTDDPLVGTVPYNSMVPLLISIRRRAPGVRMFLVPRPMQLSHNRGEFRIAVSAPAMERAARLCEEAATAVLNPHGIEFLPRLAEHVDPQTGMTPDRYSKGPLPRRPERLNEHMTGAFGSGILRTIASRMEERSGA